MCMPDVISGRRRSPRISRALLLFGLAVVLPGLLVAVVGWRTIDADRREAIRQIDDRLDNAAERALTELEVELRRWDAAVAATAAEAPSTTGVPSSPTAAAALASALGAVAIRIGPDRTSVEPRSRVLFEPDAAATALAAPSPSPAVVEAERAEYAGDHAGAAERYQRLLRDEPRSTRPTLLLKLARTLQKWGHFDDALVRYRELALLNEDAADMLPGPLAARFEICSIEKATHRSPDPRQCYQPILEDLVKGRWQISQSWYAVYSERLRADLDGQDGLSPEVKRVVDIETEKMAVTLAVAAAVEQIRRRERSTTAGHLIVNHAGRVFLVCWRQADAPDRATALLMPARASLADRFAESLAALRERDDVHIAITSGDGPSLYESAGAPTASGTRFQIRQRSRQDGDVVWTARAWPRRPDAIETDIVRRRLLYLAMLGVVLASVVVGGVLSARTVARELEVARIKAQFVSAVSHEFRTPLSGIRQFAEMLVHDRVDGDDRRRRYLRLILGASERLSRLVDNVLDFARIEDGRQAYSLDRAETTAWLRGVAAEFEDTLPAERSLIAEIPDELPAIMADGHALGRAVHNLLDNAVKYSPGEPAVWIEAAAEGGVLVIKVRDRGVGISDSDRPHVFERFFRGAALSQTVGGAGLGLSLVQHIATGHNGRVTCDSKPGESTTFALRIPVAPNSLPEGLS